MERDAGKRVLEATDLPSDIFLLMETSMDGHAWDLYLCNNTGRDYLVKDGHSEEFAGSFTLAKGRSRPRPLPTGDMQRIDRGVAYDLDYTGSFIYTVAPADAPDDTRELHFTRPNYLGFGAGEPMRFGSWEGRAEVIRAWERPRPA